MRASRSTNHTVHIKCDSSGHIIIYENLVFLLCSRELIENLNLYIWTKVSNGGWKKEEKNQQGRESLKIWANGQIFQQSKQTSEAIFRPGMTNCHVRFIFGYHYQISAGEGAYVSIFYDFWDSS